MKNSLLATLLLAGVAVLISTPSTADSPETPSHDEVFQLPQAIDDGENKEVSVLVDHSHLKLATITLRNGTALPTHSTPVPATIQVLEGEGLIHVGPKAVAVSRGTLVLLAAGEEHDVVPAPGTDMSLLVHYLRSAAGETEASHSHHDH